MTIDPHVQVIEWGVFWFAVFLEIAKIGRF